MPFGGQTVLEAVVRPLRTLDGLVIVTNAHVADAMPDSLTDVPLVVNRRLETGMIGSVRLGIRYLLETHAPAADEGVLVCPSDAPGLKAETIRRCADVFRRDPARIFIAIHEGRRGHPIVFPAALAPVVESPLCDGGLRMLGRELDERVTEVEVDDPAATRNMNTPEDYRRALEEGGY
jgi:molybdenum cofactor cytidylyltransferase